MPKDVLLTNEETFSWPHNFLFLSNSTHFFATLSENFKAYLTTAPLKQLLWNPIIFLSFNPVPILDCIVFEFSVSFGILGQGISS